MSISTIKYQSPDRPTCIQYPPANHLGQLMRDHGESYIKTFTPYRERIKLIRAMRICKSPALGGKIIICKKCNEKHYIYYSCGHSHCPICQSIKREQWKDKLSAALYKVPYVHTTFTLPHDLNGIARKNPSEIYNVLMRAAWKTIKMVSKEKSNLGALPGMISVLHTFGSDLKYHVHVHCLITFGGITKEGQWLYPQRKYKMARYRQLSSVYKTQFLKTLKSLYLQNKVTYHLSYDELVASLGKKRWVVHNTRPTINTKVLEEYLAKYINRIAITNSRLQYSQDQNKVKLIYNDYKKQVSGHAAPKAIRELHPLTAIQLFMQHVLPPYFQKSRRYGIHAAATQKRLAPIIPDTVKRNGATVRTLLEILTQLLKEKPYQCSNCNSHEYHIELISPNSSWIKQFINIPNCRSPPIISSYNTFHVQK